MDGESACTQHRHHPRRELSRADICVRTRVNPYVAPRHVIARYCAITLHLAVVQMHRGPIGETPRARKVRLSSLIYIFRPKSIVPRPENSNSRLFVRRGAWISSFFSWTITRHGFSLLLRTILRWNCFNNSFLSINVSINLSPMEQLLLDYLCKTGGNQRGSVRSMSGFII